MPRVLRRDPRKCSRESIDVVVKLLAGLVVIVIPQHQVESVRKGALNGELERLVMVAAAVDQCLGERGVLRIGTQKLADRDVLLRPQLPGHLGRRQRVVERVRHSGIHGVLHLEADPRIDLVDVPVVRQVAPEIDEVGEIGDDLARQGPLQADVDAVIHAVGEVLFVPGSGPSQVRVGAECFTGHRHQSTGERIRQRRLGNTQ